MDLSLQKQEEPVKSYITNNQNGTVVLIENKFIQVSKPKSLIRTKLHRKPKGFIKSATISRHSSGKYYISLLCKEEINELPKSNSAVGIDLGITDFAILSDGKKLTIINSHSKWKRSSNMNNVSCQEVPY